MPATRMASPRDWRSPVAKAPASRSRVPGAQHPPYRGSAPRCAPITGKFQVDAPCRRSESCSTHWFSARRTITRGACCCGRNESAVLAPSTHAIPILLLSASQLHNSKYVSYLHDLVGYTWAPFYGAKTCCCDWARLGYPTRRRCTSPSLDALVSREQTLPLCRRTADVDATLGGAQPPSPTVATTRLHAPCAL
jgi:hypothetical protein